MKVLLVVGTRPEAIKLAPMVLALRGRAQAVLVSTGQHPELVRRALADFDLTADIELAALPEVRSLAETVGTLLIAIERSLIEVAPDCVVVQGDTASALAGGLAAHYQKIKLAHVEAGLRTHDIAEPFPEEANRALLARIADWHFAPTDSAAANLVAEGISAERVLVTGNTIVDAVEMLQSRWPASEKNALQDNWPALVGKRLVLVTCHRRENQGAALTRICQALRRLAVAYPQTGWLYPVHPNPPAQEIIARELGGLGNFALCDPLDYGQLLRAMKESVLVVTDSGGLQEEAAALGRPVVILRRHTERPEIIDVGLGTLAGQDADTIVQAVSQRLDNPPQPLAARNPPNPFGDGQAAQRIVAHLLRAQAGPNA